MIVKNKKNKKSQSIAINTIIIAVLALVVLVILIAIFSGILGKSAKDLESCWLKGGKCQKESCGSDEAEIKNTKECPPKNAPDEKYCCVKVL